jgi:hypothetical protein
MKTHITFPTLFLIALLFLFACSSPIKYNESSLESQQPPSVTLDENSKALLSIDAQASNADVFNSQRSSPTEGLAYTLINNGSEYSVSKGSADTTGVVIIPEYWQSKKVTAVADYAFAACFTLESVVLPESINVIGTGAFSECQNLKTIVMPKWAESMGNIVFGMCGSLVEISIPEGIHSVGEGTFINCTNLKSVFIPEVVSIERIAFCLCRSLTHVNLPKTLETIGQMAFMNCDNLSTITSYAVVPPSIDSTVFSKCPDLTSILVPPGSIEAYKAAHGWSDFSDIIVSQ